MKSARKLLATVFASLLLALVAATAALAQTPIDPSATVTENESATAPINPFGISISIAMAGSSWITTWAWPRSPATCRA